MRTCGCIVGAAMLFVVIVIIGSLVVPRSSGTSAPSGAETATTVAGTSQLTSQADTKVAQFQSSARSRPSQLVLTEAELNAKIATQLTSQTGLIQARNVHVHLGDGVATIDAQLSAEGLSVPVQAPLMLSPTADGGVKVGLGTLDLGPAGAVPGLAQRIQDGLRQQLGDGILHFGALKVQQIAIQPGKLIITGQG